MNDEGSINNSLNSDVFRNNFHITGHALKDEDEDKQVTGEQIDINQMSEIAAV